MSARKTALESISEERLERVLAILDDMDEFLYEMADLVGKMRKVLFP